MTETWRLWLPLVALLIVCLLLAWVAQRLQQSRPHKGGPLLNLRATLNLGPRQRIAIIDVAGQSLVVGITADAITTLYHFPADDQDTQLATAPPENSAIPSWLQDYIHGPR